MQKTHLCRPAVSPLKRSASPGFGEASSEYCQKVSYLRTQWVAYSLIELIKHLRPASGKRSYGRRPTSDPQRIIASKWSAIPSTRRPPICRRVDYLFSHSRELNLQSIKHSVIPGYLRKIVTIRDTSKLKNLPSGLRIICIREIFDPRNHRRSTQPIAFCSVRIVWEMSWVQLHSSKAEKQTFDVKCPWQSNAIWRPTTSVS